jgi:hypothetical protein
MEARSKGENVGGNIDTSSARVRRDGCPDYFDVDESKEYLWGLEDVLRSAVRCALAGRENAMMARLMSMNLTLRRLHSEAAKPLSSSDTEWHTMRVFLKHTHPFRDF